MLATQKIKQVETSSVEESKLQVTVFATMINFVVRQAEVNRNNRYALKTISLNQTQQSLFLRPFPQNNSVHRRVHRRVHRATSPGSRSNMLRAVVFVPPNRIAPESNYPHPTTNRNRQITHPTSMTAPPEDLWIFGYSSLLWKYDDVEHTRSEFGYIEGHVRRFFQGSTDHRGTPTRPGLVASLYTTGDIPGSELPATPLRVHGRAFQVTGASRATVIERLDGREVDGYVHRWLPVYTKDHKLLVERALVYVAPPTNPQYAGCLSDHEIVYRVLRCRGNSGPNREYLENLAIALRAEDVFDEHIEALVKLLPPTATSTM